LLRLVIAYRDFVVGVFVFFAASLAAIWHGYMEFRVIPDPRTGEPALDLPKKSLFTYFLSGLLLRFPVHST
jgi:hypothetical protein